MILTLFNTLILVSQVDAITFATFIGWAASSTLRQILEIELPTRKVNLAGESGLGLLRVRTGLD